VYPNLIEIVIRALRYYVRPDRPALRLARTNDGRGGRRCPNCIPRSSCLSGELLRLRWRLRSCTCLFDLVGDKGASASVSKDSGRTLIVLGLDTTHAPSSLSHRIVMPATRAVVVPAVRGSGALRSRQRKGVPHEALRSLSCSSSSPDSYQWLGSSARGLCLPLQGMSNLHLITANSRLKSREGITRCLYRSFAMRRWSSTTDLSQTARSSAQTPGQQQAIPTKPSPTPSSAPTQAAPGSSRSATSGLRRPKVLQTTLRSPSAPLFRLSALSEEDAYDSDAVGQTRSHRDGLGHVLESVALECDLVLSQYRQASESTKDEMLWVALGCLLDVSRRPGLPEALRSRNNSGEVQQATSKLRIHRAFITLLSTAASAMNANMDGETDRAGAEEDKENGIAARMEQVMQLARQARRLSLPLPLPLYERLAQTALSIDNEEDNFDISIVAPSSSGTGARISYTASTLLEIAEWHALKDVPQLDVMDEGLEQPANKTVAAEELRHNNNTAAKLRFLVPALTFLIERRRYRVALDAISALLIRADGHDPSFVMDFNTLFDLMMASRQAVVSSPADVMEIRQILELLEPHVQELLVANKAVLQSHPHVRGFFHRYFLSDEDDELDDVAAEDDPYEVWDSIVARMLTTTADADSSIDPAATFEERIAAVSDFYATMDAAVDAKLIQISRIHHMPTFLRDASADVDASSSSSSDDDDDEEGSNDSDWSSDSDTDDEEGDDESEELDGLKLPGRDAAEVAMRRHHLYVRGRGRALSAGYFPDVLAQAIHLNSGLNLRYTDEYENWLWTRDFQDDDEDLDDLSLLTLHDSDTDPYSSDDDGDDHHSR
jgi:hypothetical protein